MLEIENFPLFVGASLMLAVTPGPHLAYTLSRSIAQGRRAGWLSTCGICTGLCIHSIAAALGLSAVLATSATAFTIAKSIGALYLIYLGVKALLDRSSSISVDASRPQMSGWQIYRQGILVDLLNPKSALFFLAFLPQFIHTAGGRVGQFIFLGMTATMIELVYLFFLVLFATQFTHRLHRNRQITTWINRFTGAIFVGLGVKLASEK